MELFTLSISVAALALAGFSVGLLIAMRREVDSRARRTEAYLTLQSVLRLGRPLPWPRPYSASPEFLRVLVDVLFERRPRVVLELGSGVSTVVTAQVLRQLGGGRVISIENEARFAAQTRALVAAHGLSDLVEVVVAPLAPCGLPGHETPWYDRQIVLGRSLSEVGLVVVDGPPGKGAPLARHPAFPVLAAQVAPDAWFLVDDARRRDEREMVKRWLALDSGLSAEVLPTEKGTIILRRGQPAEAAAPVPPQSSTYFETSAE
jgi:Methyltransferase domain